MTLFNFLTEMGLTLRAERKPDCGWEVRVAYLVDEYGQHTGIAEAETFELACRYIVYQISGKNLKVIPTLGSLVGHSSFPLTAIPELSYSPEEFRRCLHCDREISLQEYLKGSGYCVLCQASHSEEYVNFRDGV